MSGALTIPASVTYSGKTYSVTTIGSCAFYGCSGLTSVTIPNSVTHIDVEAFNGCSGLTSVTIPNSVTAIYPRAFAGCSGLASIKVESGNITYNCNAIIETATNSLICGCKNTVIPNSVTANNSRVKNAYGKQGSPDGNSSTGELRGQPGIDGLVGYTLEYWGRPHSKWEGTVKVRVRVNTRGRVVEAKAVSGTGPAWTHPEVQRDCEKESLKSAFSVPKNTTTDGVGYITWRFI